MKRPPTTRASGCFVWITTVLSSGVSIDVTFEVAREQVAFLAERLERVLDVLRGDRLPV